MERSARDLREAVARFRRARAASYLAQLAGEDVEPAQWVDFEAPCHPERVAAYPELARALPVREHAALGAHMVRAHVERTVRPDRTRAAALGLREVEALGQRRPLAAHFGDGRSFRDAAARGALLRASEHALADMFEVQSAAQRRAAEAAGEAFARLSPGRHPDAGPEGGSEAEAEAFLRDGDGLCREAVAQVARDRGHELRHVVDLFAALRAVELADMRRERRGHRLGELWRPWALRDLLNRAVRLGPSQVAAWPACQVIAGSAPATIRLAPSAVEAGLLSELALLEATGRALSLACVASALPVELRWPAVGSVARLWGKTAALGLAHAGLWQRAYGVGRETARVLGRATATALLCRFRLDAAALLARGKPREEVAGLASRALGVEVPPALAWALLLRLSPGGDARAALHAPGMAAALRERFDEDWLRNPRAAEPLVGASLRGGETSAEALAAELGASHKAGLALLAEVF